MNIAPKEEMKITKSEITGITAQGPETVRSELSRVVPASELITRSYNKELREGIVGLKNNSLYCYMNACLQCLLPIEELRDYYVCRQYKRFNNMRCISDSFTYSDGICEFLREAFDCDSRSQVVLNPTSLKNLIRKTFYPTMQHDSHEFFIHLLSQL